MIKTDLHLHSVFSSKPAGFFSKKLGMQESYILPRQIYDTLYERGMNLFTITDHDEINGCLEIGHLPNTFISEEATVYFPEDRCKIHVLCYDINEKIHKEIQKLRYNVYELTDYLQQENVTHSLAHPLYNMDGKLSKNHIEKTLLLFDNWELINGTRSGLSSKLTKEIAEHFTGEKLDLLADKHGFNRRQRANISYTAGSDDHNGMDIGSTYTQCEGSTTQDLKNALGTRATTAQGDYGSPVRLTHMIMGISYRWAKDQSKSESALLDYLFSNSKMNLFTRIVGLKKIKNYTKLISGIEEEVSPANRHELIHSFFKNFFPYLVKEFATTKKFDIEKISTLLGKSMLSAIPAFFYLSVYWQRAQEKKSSRQIYRKLIKDKKDVSGKVVYFTDTFNEINGVALTSKKILNLARERELNLTMVTAYDENVDDLYRKNFTPVLSFDLPEYEEITVNIPQFLDMLEYVDRENFDVVYAATPGILGLYAFLIAKILHIPYVTTFHTDFPEYIGKYSDDHMFKDHIWNGFSMLLNSSSRVLSPSKEYKRVLISNGVKRKKIEVFTRGVNHDKFNVGFREENFWKKFDDSLQNEKIVLFVGRVAKEKNLDAFLQVSEILEKREDVKFAVVGDGPYLSSIKPKYEKSVIFTGFMEKEELSRTFASSDIFLFPSHTETFGNVALESQASGLPTIVSDKGAIKENVEDGVTGFVIGSENPFDYAKKVEFLLDNPTVYESMKKSGVELMKQRDEKELLYKMIKLFSMGKISKREAEV